MARPKLSTLIGAIVGEWGAIDGSLATIFNFLSYSDNTYGSHREDPLATALFATLVSYSAKTDMILTAARLRTPSILPALEELLQEIKRSSSARNDAVHAVWRLSDSFPDDLVMLDINGFGIRYTEKCLREILRQATAARNKVLDFTILVASTPRVEPKHPSPKEASVSEARILRRKSRAPIPSRTGKNPRAKT